MPDRRIAVLAIDRVIVVLRPCRDFMLEIGVKSAVPEICKIEDKIFIFTGIQLVTTEPAEDNVIALLRNRFRQQKMRQPGGRGDRFIMGADHLADDVEQIEAFDRYRLPTANLLVHQPPYISAPFIASVG